MISSKQTIFIFSFIYLLTVLYFYYTLSSQNSKCIYINVDFQHPANNKNQTTCLILEFEDFDNDLYETVQNVCKFVAKVVIVSQTVIYPWIEFSSIKHCKVVLLEKDKSIFYSYSSQNIESIINSQYIIVIPDSTRVPLNQSSFELINLYEKTQSDVLLFPLYTDWNAPLVQFNCKNFSFDVKKWTLTYFNTIKDLDTSNCKYESDNGFVLFTTTSLFFKMSQPISRPFIHSFLIQSSLVKQKVSLINYNWFVQGRKLFTNNRFMLKHEQSHEQRLTLLYHSLGIKKIIHQNYSIEWYGCKRHSARCFPTINDNIPQFLVQDRLLPPCCRHHLEITGRYVFSLFDKKGIRYWLEGGSLLGAARNNHIIDWDYDIDIGIYREDSIKFLVLDRLLQSEPGSQIEDGQGFVWEKAIEGDFVKVHYSKTNRIHVDIFPFVSKGDIMTKDTWFEDHPQDMPFPEHFLMPLTRIEFIGYNASAPNNVRQFLEMKFGKNSIETPKYPFIKQTNFN